jgi:hypothetical protein
MLPERQKGSPESQKFYISILGLVQATRENLYPVQVVNWYKSYLSWLNHQVVRRLYAQYSRRTDLDWEQYNIELARNYQSRSGLG